MKRLKIEYKSPKGGWFYVVPETGLKVTAGSKQQLLEQVGKHYRTNDMTVPANYEERVIDQICDRVPHSCTETADMPSAARMALNAWAALREAVASGFKTVTEEEKDRRISICSNCDQLQQGPKPRCLKCGCYMRFKPTMEAWHCPIGKW